LSEGFQRYRKLRGGDLFRFVLDPSGPGKDLIEFALGDCANDAILVK
jgi:hypothetical protein